jgi:hypothetical protein
VSRDIDVVPFRDLAVRSLIERSGRIAAIVLNVARASVELDVRRIERGSERAMDGAEMLSVGESCVVGFRGELPAGVTTYRIPRHADMAPEDRFPHAGISVFGRSASRFVMAPIVAIAIADLVGGVLLGDTNLGDWLEGVPSEARVSPVELLASIKLATPQPNLQSAIVAFCSRTSAGRGHVM